MSIAHNPPDNNRLDLPLIGNPSPDTNDAGSTNNGGEVGRLGTYTNVSDILSYEDFRRIAYRRREVARGILPHEKVAICMTFTVPGKMGELMYSESTGHAHLRNLALCENAWHCPVCSAIKNQEAGEKLQSRVEAWTAQGGGVLLVTTTLQHTPKDSLEGLRSVLMNSVSKTFSSRWFWKGISLQYGLSGWVRGVEILYNSRAGWHPHAHMLLFTDKILSDSEILELEARLQERWAYVVAKNGGYASEIYGLTLRNGESAARYLTKMQKTWDLSAELTKSGAKTSGSISPFELLDRFEDGDQRAGFLFREYAETMKGKQQIRYSNGFEAVLDALPVVDQEQDRDQEQGRLDDDILVIALTARQYQTVFRAGRVLELLEVCEITKGDSELVWQYLLSIGVKPAVHVDIEARKWLEKFKVRCDVGGEV